VTSFVRRSNSIFPTCLTSSSLSDSATDRWLGIVLCEDTGDERVELGVVPRDVSGERGADTMGESGRYISLRGGSLNGPASGLSDGSFKSESSGSSSGYNLLDDATDEVEDDDSNNFCAEDPR